MSKRRRKVEVTTDDDSGWLLSYADMMTLVACFFILMMAFANFDPVGFSKKTKVISKAFRKNKYKSSLLKLKNIEEEVAKHPEIKKMAKVTVSDGKLIMVISGTVLFESGKYELSQKSIRELQELIEIIKGQSINYKILVEGHTDSLDAKYNENMSSNWQLSSARSSHVISYFEQAGFHPRNLIAIGMGDSKPLAPDTDQFGQLIENNMRGNRRVVIKVLDFVNPKTEKLGFGVYFSQEN